LFYTPDTVIKASFCDNTVNNETIPPDNYWENIERNAKKRHCNAIIRIAYFPV
jgi:hypothetical protein